MRTRDDEVRRILWAALALSATVAAAKLACGRLAHFAALEADGWHSLADGASSLVALVGVGLARRPPDADHPYGHRKFEVLATCVIGAWLVLFAANTIADAAGHQQGGGRHVPLLDAATLVVLGSTLAVNLGVSMVEARAGVRLASPLLLGDAQHTRADCYVTGGVLMTGLLARWGMPELDVAAAVIIALWIGRTGVGIVTRNARWLADTALIDPLVVIDLVGGIPSVVGVHSIRTRGMPGEVFMDLRLRVPESLTIADTQRVARRVTRAILEGIEGVVDVVVQTECSPDGPA